MATNSPSHTPNVVERRSSLSEAGAPPSLVYRLFEQHVRAHPERIALLFEEGHWTYDELNRRANRLAHRLRQLGVGPDDPVGVHVQRSPHLVATLLGILKAGGTYVALDPTLPPKRLRFMSEDADIDTIVVSGSEGQRDWDVDTVVDVTAPSLKREGEENLDVDVHEENLAYILYTSGTTGRPKGVMQPHRSLWHHAHVFGEEIGQIAPDCTYLFKTSYTFDLSISEIFPPLINGARVAVAEPEARGGQRLVQTIQQHRVTDLLVTPTRLRLLIDHDDFRDCSTLRRVYSAGEALSGDVRDEFLDRFDISLFNLYGTTEMCCGQTGLNCTEEKGSGTVTSIGRPWSSYDAYITDTNLQLTSNGEPGDLLLGGVGEARGYRGMPRETALRFVPDALSGHPGRRVYRTGDIARWNPEGRLEYLGRDDGQIQVQGVRVEISEVEAKLSEADGVDLSAVRPINEHSGKADGLVAYIVPEEGRSLDRSVLREWIETHFPNPAVPRRFCVLDEMPLLPSGKIDYSALPDPSALSELRENGTSPKTKTQRQLAEIWKKHLDLDEVHLQENFFRIGGHSLLAVRIQHEIADRFGAEVPLETFLEAPTIAALAETIDPQGDLRYNPIESREYGDEVPLSPSQRRMWFLQKLNPDSVAYNVPAVIRLDPDVDVSTFRRALTRLIERHEVLRTIFPERDGTPVQKILPPPDRISWAVDDLRDAKDPEQEAKSLINQRIQEPFDLTEETPLRISMMQISDEEWLFCSLFHHIAIDEWTFDVLLEDLEDLYEDELIQAEDSNHLLPSIQRTAEWQETHEVLHQDLSATEIDDPTLNTTGWVNSFDGEPYSQEEMRDWLQGRIELLRSLDLGRTLEIGSGTGMLLFRLAPYADEYVGLDFSQGALDYIDEVRKQLDQDFSHVSLVHGRADEVGDLNGEFDTILLDSVLQYFPDYHYLDTVLHAATEKLGPEGTLYIGDVRDRRLAYAFHASVQRARASTDTTRATLREQAKRALKQENELLVSPQHLVQLAKGLPGITGIDFTLPRAEHPTEMSVFRYDALLHAGADTDVPIPDEVLSWREDRLDIEALRARLEENEDSLLVTAVPNARVQEALQFQYWLHQNPDAASLATFTPNRENGVEAFDPDIFRQIGDDAGYRVTISPSNDPAGEYFDVAFEPRSSDLPPFRPFTPLTAELSSILAPVPPPDRPSNHSLNGTSFSLWRGLLNQDDDQTTSSSSSSTVGPPELPIQYADYAIWQQEQLQGPRYEEAKAYWAEKLESATERRLNWPFEGIDQDQEFGPAQSVELDVDDELAEKLNACADRQNTTMSVVFLAAFGTLLSRYTGQSDMTVGIPVTNRDRPELHRLVGMLLNTLPFPLHVHETLGFDELVDQLGSEWREAMSRKWVPFEDIVEAVGAERSGKKLPLFDVMFTYVPSEGSEEWLESLGEVEIGPIEFDLPEALCPLFLIVTEHEDSYRVRFRYDSTRFDESTIRRMVGHFEQLLVSGLEASDAPLHALNMLPSKERRRLTDRWAKGPRIDVPDAPIHRLFEEKAETHPERTAVVSEQETWTYWELNRRANRLAHRLLEAGVRPGVPVGVSMDRSPSLIAALLGVLKAGGAYVALPPSLPEKRLRYMVEDAGVEMTVVDDPSREIVGERRIDAGVIQDDRLPDENPAVDVPLQELAYILYTSGTTGTPKGVMIPHAAVTDLIIVMKTHFPVGKNDAILLKTPYSFDVSVSEIFNPLMAGARIVTTPPEAEKNPQFLCDRIQETGVTVLRMTPTELSNLLQAEGIENCTSVRRVFAAGEALTPAVRDDLRDVWGRVELVNLWGPTEACVYGSWWPCEAENEDDSVPIGWPLSNFSLYNLDEEMDLVPAGIQGELFGAGSGLARGYRGMPRKTATTYLPNPYSDEPGARMYKTGDLVHWNDGGHLHFGGRKDNQIQLRGIRIELGEIEAHLEKAPAVTQAVVRPIEGDDSRVESLVAYVVPENHHEVNAGELREHLREYLPSSVLPGRYVELEEMPRTPSGKIDRDGLPEPEKQTGEPEPAEQRTETEALITAIWSDILDLEDVRRTANFFEVGGNSLAAVKVHLRLQQHVDEEVDLVHLFEHPTVAQLATFLESLDSDQEASSDARGEHGRRRRARLQHQQRRRSGPEDS